MRDSIRLRALHVWSHFVSRHPILVIAVALLLAAGAVVLTVTRLEFNPNRNDLISPDLSWNQRFIAWQSHFPGSGDLVVVVDSMQDMPGRQADHTQARAMVDELGAKLSQSAELEHVVWGFDAGAFSPKAIRLLPMEAMESRLREMQQAQLLLASPSMEALFRSSVNAMRQQQSQESQPSTQEAVDGIEGLRRLVLAVKEVLATPVDQPVEVADIIAGPDASPGWQYLRSDNGRLYFIRITPRLEEDSLNAVAPAISAIRQVLSEVSPRYPNVEAGLTGIDVVESDETAAATWDSTWTSMVAAVLITMLLVVAFHSWRLPVLAMVALLIAIAWSFGFLTLAIGHLQVLSVVFTLILLGLGIDYAVHLASTFELLRHEYADDADGFSQALAATLQRVGPALFTGAVTTSIAFATTLFTDFTGVAEMGLVAGVGILLCLLSMVSVFPALLRLFRAGHRHVVRMDDRKVHVFDERWIGPFWKHPRVTLTTAAVLFGLSCLAMSTMRFDYDLLALQPRGVDSVAWQQRIVDRGQQSIWFGVSVTDNLEQARELAHAYRKLPNVLPRLGGVGLLFPTQEEKREALLTQTRASLQPGLNDALASDQAPASGAGLSVQLAVLRQSLPAALTGQMPAQVRDALQRLQETLDETTTLARGLEGDHLNQRLARAEREYLSYRQSVAQVIDASLDPAPLTLSDVPPVLMRSYISDQGKLAMEIYPKLPEHDPRVAGPLSPHFLPGFVQALQRVDPQVTGVVMQVYRSGDLIKHAYQLAGIGAFIAVLLLVWVDFRSMVDALLAMAPVAAGFGITFGLMWLLGVQINPANIIVLPLMFGIGVDAGVHMLHRYRSQPTHRPLGLAHGTGKGITLTSFTTMIGFGVMMLASHRGIASLGFVLFSGIGLTLLACWTILPAWLELRQARARKRIKSSLPA